MGAKEKAKELVNKYYNYVSGCTVVSKPTDNTMQVVYEGEEMKLGRAKQCALIAVDEIIEAVRYRTLYELGEDVTEEIYVKHYEQVKTEIEKL